MAAQGGPWRKNPNDVFLWKGMWATQISVNIFMGAGWAICSLISKFPSCIVMSKSVKRCCKPDSLGLPFSSGDQMDVTTTEGVPVLEADFIRLLKLRFIETKRKGVLNDQLLELMFCPPNWFSPGIHFKWNGFSHFLCLPWHMLYEQATAMAVICQQLLPTIKAKGNVNEKYYGILCKIHKPF